jgi:hypothetical protein
VLELEPALELVLERVPEPELGPAQVLERVPAQVLEPVWHRRQQ